MGERIDAARSKQGGETVKGLWVLVVDKIGYTNFSNRNNFKAFFSSQRVTTDRFSIPISRAGTYYFILSNRFSILTDKRVDLQVELRYEEKK